MTLTDQRQSKTEQTHSARRLNFFGSLVDVVSYLEVGVFAGETFLSVEAPRKVAVDPRFQFDVRDYSSPEVEFHQMTSDKYFTGPGRNERFELAFVDGLHTYAQTLADLRNVLMRTDDQALILLDDTLPSDPFSALPDRAEASALRKAYGNNPNSGAWHGDVYKVVVYIHDFLPDLSYATFGDGGNPQTVVWRERRTAVVPYTSHPSEIDHLSFPWLLRNRSVLCVAPEDVVLKTVFKAFDGRSKPGQS